MPPKDDDDDLVQQSTVDDGDGEASIYTHLNNYDPPSSSLSNWPEVKLCLARKSPIVQQSDARRVGIELQTNEDGMVMAKTNEDGSVQFSLKHVDLAFKMSKQFEEFDGPSTTNYPVETYGPLLNITGIDRAILHVTHIVREPNAEWQAVMQIRVYVALASAEQKFKIAMAEFFELGTGKPPLQFQLTPNIGAVNLDCRFVYQSYHVLPTFAGDLAVHFTPTDEDPICVNKALMALYAPKIMNAITTPYTPMGISREEFTEMLYQIYVPKRSLDSADFPALCKAATKVGGEFLLWPISQHIIMNSKLSIKAKMKKAMDLGLNDVIRQLCHDAVKSGEWNVLHEKQGFDPRTFFDQHTYCKVVLPAVIEAIKEKNSPDPIIRGKLYEHKHPRPLPIFNNPLDAGNPHNIQLRVEGKTFYVNRGVLEINGPLEKWIRSEEGIYSPNVSAELKEQMEHAKLRLEQVLVNVLFLLYGTAVRVKSTMLRACLVFAYDHGMRYVVEQLEEMLLDEFVESPEIMLSHFLLAERYKLKNLERKSLWQLELQDCYQQLGLDMIALKEYAQLSECMKVDVEDRLCSGWALFNKKLAKRTPTNVTGFILKHSAKDANAESLWPFGKPTMDDLMTWNVVADASFEQINEPEDDVNTAIVMTPNPMGTPV